MNCRGCGAPLLWERTAAGKPMPLNPDPDPSGNVSVQPIGGVDVAIVLNKEDAAAAQVAGQKLFMPHWKTCPNAKDFR